MNPFNNFQDLPFISQILFGLLGLIGVAVVLSVLYFILTALFSLYRYRFLIMRQIKQNFGRFLLASGGIAVGVWAITLTTGLSIGVSDTITKAINSQEYAKEILSSKLANNNVDFFGSSSPEFAVVGDEDIAKIKEEIPSIDIANPFLTSQYYLHAELVQDQIGEQFSNILDSEEEVPAEFQDYVGQLESVLSGPKGDDFSCKEFANNTPEIDLPEGTPDSLSGNIDQLLLISSGCFEVDMIQSNFGNLRKNFTEDKWIGSEEKPEKGQMVACFRCGSLFFDQLMEVEEPEELLGKTIKFELSTAPALYKKGTKVQFDQNNAGQNLQTETQVETPTFYELEIVSVIDDRNNALLGQQTLFYIDPSYYTESVEIANPGINLDDYGYTQIQFIVDSFDNLKDTVDKLDDRGFFNISAGLILIQGVQSLFTGLTVVLAIFGLIAVIASIFGIVNVMAISVLERRKEIGILKSLGSRDRKIFDIFVSEASVLGLLGWIIGSVSAIGLGYLITFGGNKAIAGNEEIANSLEIFGITTFSPSFPWWIFLVTMVISLFFSTISGVLPARRASRQNPVDALRGE